MTLKLAVIGCGKQAPKHVDALRRGGTAVEPTFVDISADRARALGEHYGSPWSTDIAGVIADSSITAVDICTPTPTHYDLICDALAAGKHVFCEKPLCQTLEEARDLTQRQERAGCVGMVGYIYRFAGPFQHLYRLLNDGGAEGTPALAQPHLGLFRIGGRGSHQVWKHRAAEGGGARNEMLVHMLDLALWCLGSPDKVELLGQRLIRQSRAISGIETDVDAEDFCLLRMEMANGTEVVIEADLLTPAFSQHVEVQGNNGSFFGSIQKDLPSVVTLDRTAGGYQAGRTDLSTPPVDPFADQLQGFVDAMNGRPPVGFASFRDSLRIAEILNQLD